MISASPNSKESKSPHPTSLRQMQDVILVAKIEIMILNRLQTRRSLIRDKGILELSFRVVGDSINSIRVDVRKSRKTRKDWPEWGRLGLIAYIFSQLDIARQV